LRDQARTAGGTGMGEPTPPVLQELEALSLFFGIEEFEAREISIQPLLVTVRGTVESLELAEELTEMLQNFQDPLIEDWERRPLQRSGSRVEVSFAGTWSDRALGAGNGGGGE
jgi:hypothetical protein